MDLSSLVNSAVVKRVYGNVTVSNEANAHLGDTFHFHGSSTQDQAELEQKARLELLRALAYENMNTKRRQLAEHNAESLDWIWRGVREGGAGFVDWLVNDRTTFWITGKPGSGKSTIMKFISEHSICPELLCNGSDQRWLIVNFYFDYRAGSNVANNLEGLLRSILFQLIRDNQAAQQAVQRHRLGKQLNIDRNTLDQQQLRILLGIACKAVATESRYKICGFLDGLDEFTGHHLEVMRMLDFLLASGFTKLCVASRPEYIIYQHLQHNAHLRMQDHNSPTIQTYVSSILDDLPRVNADIDIPQFAVEVTRAAEGVILWAVIVTQQLADSFLAGETEDELRERLHDFPKELGEVYERILSSSPLAHRRETAFILQLVRTAGPSVTAWDVHSALVFLWHTHQLPSWPEKPLTGTAFFLRLRARTGSMIDIVPDTTEIPAVESTAPEMQKRFNDRARSRLKFLRLFHKTLDHYLTSSGWIQENLALQDLYPSLDDLWLHLCTQSLRANEINQSEFEQIHTYLARPLSAEAWFERSGDDDRLTNARSAKIAHGLAHSYTVDSDQAFLDFAICFFPSLVAQRQRASTDQLPMLRKLLGSHLCWLHSLRCYQRTFESPSNKICQDYLCSKELAIIVSSCSENSTAIHKSSYIILTHGIYDMYKSFEDSNIVLLRNSPLVKDFNRILQHPFLVNSLLKDKSEGLTRAYSDMAVILEQPEITQIVFDMSIGHIPLDAFRKLKIICPGTFEGISQWSIDPMILIPNKPSAGALPGLPSQIVQDFRDLIGCQNSVLFIWLWAMSTTYWKDVTIAKETLMEFTALKFDLNATCSIFGGALHTLLYLFAIGVSQVGYTDHSESLFKILINLGAKTSQVGPDGSTVIETLRKMQRHPEACSRPSYLTLSSELFSRVEIIILSTDQSREPE